MGSWESETELAYAAGLFDGEGSVMIRLRPGGRFKPGRERKRYHLLTVSLSSTDEVIIAWLNQRWPGVVNQHVYRNERHKPAWRWILDASKAEAFLHDVRPYLILKGPQADLAFQLRATLVGRGKLMDPAVQIERERIAEAMHALNKRGR